MPKKILITGAAGFLGSHLMLHHLRAGDDVLGLDNFSSSSPTSLQRNLIDSLLLSEAETRKGRDGLFLVDITNRSEVFDAVARCGQLGWRFDIIYNFACPASPPRYQDMPIETMMTCVVGTKNMLDIARHQGAILVHASTSEVYGDPDRSPQEESYRGCVNSYGPRSCYDEGKRAAEALCFDYLHKHDTDARLVRIFNTYGPHMDPDDGRVVSNLIVQGLRGKDLTVFGEGSQTRSFCYVDDLIRAIVAMGALPKNPGTPINIGNPNEFTVLELTKMIQTRLGGNIIHKPLPIDDPLQRCPDITRARDLLGWEPKIHLAEGLEKTIEYFKKVT